MSEAIWVAVIATIAAITAAWLQTRRVTHRRRVVRDPQASIPASLKRLPSPDSTDRAPGRNGDQISLPSGKPPHSRGSNAEPVRAITPEDVLGLIAAACQSGDYTPVRGPYTTAVGAKVLDWLAQRNWLGGRPEPVVTERKSERQ